MTLNCIICDCEDMLEIKDKLRDSNEHKVFKCIRCGQVQINPIPTIDEDRNYYNNNSQAKTVFNSINMKVMKSKTAADVNRRFEIFKDRINKNMKLLEVGCGYGFFVEHLKNKGYNIEGIEISNSRREYGIKELGCEIHDINLLSKDVSDSQNEKYDTIFLFHVLEHISEPEKFLNNIRKLLKKEGTLIIEVPNLDDHMLVRSEEYRNFYFQRAHITYFDKLTLTNLMIKSGYTNMEFEGVQRYNLYNALNWIHKGEPLLGYKESNEIEWVEEYYKNNLTENMKCDTLVAYCRQ